MMGRRRMHENDPSPELSTKDMFKLIRPTSRVDPIPGSPAGDTRRSSPTGGRGRPPRRGEYTPTSRVDPNLPDPMVQSVVDARMRNTQPRMAPGRAR